MYKNICITNRNLVNGSLIDQLEKLCQMDIDLFILREKDLSENEYEALAIKAIDICKKHGKILMLHSFKNVAGRLDHPFIHLSMNDFLNLNDEERAYFKMIGVSTHSVEEALTCEKMQATYITASHIFPTDCKKDLAPRGLKYLKDVCDSVERLEVYALGGINDENKMLCIEAGADGVCQMSGYMKA